MSTDDRDPLFSVALPEGAAHLTPHAHDACLCSVGNNLLSCKHAGSFVCARAPMAVAWTEYFYMPCLLLCMPHMLIHIQACEAKRVASGKACMHFS